MPIIQYFEGADFKSDILFQIWYLVSKIFSPNSQIWAFWAKKSQLSNLNEMWHLPYFKSANFKSGICFRKFRAKIPKSVHVGPKSIHFLILTKFYLYPISKVLISNLTFVFEKFEPKSPNVGILGQNASTI